MATQTIAVPQSKLRGKPGRPRRALDGALVQRMRDDGKTLNEIAGLVGCGRGTVARALQFVPPQRKSEPARQIPLSERAGDLARRRADPARDDTEARLRAREHARHLVRQRWGDRMQVEGRRFPPAEPRHDGSGWAGVALIVGGLLLWAIGCPVPL
jgi:hypothetical protein